MNPLAFIDQHKKKIAQTYHDLHALAELSWQEEKTANYLKNILITADIKVKTFKNHHGFIAEIQGTDNSVIALRADMDALLQEVAGVTKANHSCGHDAHSTMVLYTALAIASSQHKLKHTLRFIFQPAEEKAEGALQMIKEGALENVISLYGIHLRPNKEIPFNKASPIILHGSTETIIGTIKGMQAHASRPEDGINAIEVAALIAIKLKQFHLETDVSYSIKMTQLQTETAASNVIPENVKFAIDVRAQTNQIMDQLNSLVKKLFESVMHETKAFISWSITGWVPAAVFNEQAVNIASQAITDIIGSENLLASCPSPGGEDFHFYTNRHPTIRATMIGLGCHLLPGLHHPQMQFNLEALQYGTKILTQTILLTANE